MFEIRPSRNSGGVRRRDLRDRPVLRREARRGAVAALRESVGSRADARGVVGRAGRRRRRRVRLRPLRAGRPCVPRGVTVVGVYPTHRRRGVLRAMMDAQLDDVHERGEPIAALWATRGDDLRPLRLRDRVVGGEVKIAASGTRSRSRSSGAALRLRDADEARELFPPVWDALRRERPGVFARSPEWWELRAFADPERGEGESQALRRARARRLRLQGYAIFRHMRASRRVDDCGARGRRGDRRDAAGDGGVCGASCSTSTGPRRSRRTAAARSSAVPAAREPAPAAVPDGRRAVGAARRRRRCAVGARRTQATAMRSSSTCATRCARGTRAGGSSRAAARRVRMRRRTSRSTCERSGRRISVRSSFEPACAGGLGSRSCATARCERADCAVRWRPLPWCPEIF